jgi:DNA-binding IclR family transcriptional regulator
MAEWSFLTNHARALVCIAHDPGVRLRDIAAALGITERTAFGIVADLNRGGLRRQGQGRSSQSLPHPGAPPPARSRQSGANDR